LKELVKGRRVLQLPSGRAAQGSRDVVVGETAAEQRDDALGLDPRCAELEQDPGRGEAGARVSSDTRIWTLFDVRNWTPFVMLMQLRQEA
jgi:hypothetical protein